jgi:hypothetical protein
MQEGLVRHASPRPAPALRAARLTPPLAPLDPAGPSSAGAPFGADACSALTITYTLPGAGSAGDDAPYAVCDPPCGAGGGALAAAGSLPPPPGAPATAGGARDSASGGECLLRLPFTLELEAPPKGLESQPHLRIELLGPPSAVAGEALALTWQLTRVADAPGAAAASGGGGGGGSRWGSAAGAAGEEGGPEEGEEDEEVIWYEVRFHSAGLAPSAAGGGGGSGALSSSGWPGSGGGAAAGGAPPARRQGCVRLGRRAGSVASVEARAVAVAPGLQEAPRLALLGVPEAEQEQPDAGIFVAAA